MMKKREKRKELARKALKQALEDFHYPSVPDPIITDRKLDNFSLRVNEKTWQIELSIRRSLPLEKESLVKYYRCLWRFGISYYLVCPRDMHTSVEIITSAIFGSNREMGTIIANLFIDLVVEYFLARTFPDETLWFRKTRAHIVKHSHQKTYLHTIFTLVLEILLEQNIMSEKFYRKVPESDRQLAGEITNIVRKAGILNKETWPKKVKEIAELLSHELRDTKKWEGVRRLFPRDASRQDIFKAFLRGGVPIQEGRKEEVAKIIYSATEGEPLASAAALYAVGIVKKPKEAARYWYRARASDILRVKTEQQKKEEQPFKAVPEVWKLSDPTEELDVLLTLSSFPLPIPNQTTKKWRKEKKNVTYAETSPPDMLIVLDTSNSMYYPPSGTFVSEKDWREKKSKMNEFQIKYPYKSKLDTAVVASFAALEGAVERNCKVAAINFSGKWEKVDWTEKREKVENLLLKFRGDGTAFPNTPFEELVKATKNKVLVVMISDSAIYNEEEAAESLSRIAEKNHLYFFKIGEAEEGEAIIKQVRKAGGHIFQVSDPQKLPNIVGKKTGTYYVFSRRDS